MPEARKPRQRPLLRALLYEKTSYNSAFAVTTLKGKTMNIVQRALHIQKTLGTRFAAGFLRNRKVSLHLAIQVLGGKL